MGAEAGDVGDGFCADGGEEGGVGGVNATGELEVVPYQYTELCEGGTMSMTFESHGEGAALPSHISKKMSGS